MSDCFFSTHCSCSSRAWCVSVLQVPIKNIERELICPICKELFTHPLILPCQHSVCHKCVKELLMLNQDDSFSTDAGSECSNPGSPRSRVPSPSMERLDRLVRSGASQLWVSAATHWIWPLNMQCSLENFFLIQSGSLLCNRKCKKGLWICYFFLTCGCLVHQCEIWVKERESTRRKVNLLYANI